MIILDFYLKFVFTKKENSISIFEYTHIEMLFFYLLCVCELEVLLDMNQSNVSRHLGKLKAAGIIVSTKDAQWVSYVIDESFKTSHELLHDYLKAQFEKETLYLTDLKKLSTYKNSDLTCQMITEDKVNVIKVLSQK